MQEHSSSFNRRNPITFSLAPPFEERCHEFIWIETHDLFFLANSNIVNKITRIRLSQLVDANDITRLVFAILPVFGVHCCHTSRDDTVSHRVQSFRLRSRIIHEHFDR